MQASIEAADAGAQREKEIVARERYERTSDANEV